jgi:hypothetical protein
MRKLLALAALVGLGAVSFTANAQLPTVSAGNGGVILSVWDPTLNVSSVYALPGLDYDTVKADPTVLNGFTAALPGFGTTFASSDPANLLFNVTAGGDDDGLSGTQGAMVTGLISGTTVAGVSGAWNAINTFDTNANTVCGTTSPCVATTNLSGAWAGTQDDNIAAQVLGAGPGAVGSALGFYLLTKPQGGRPAATDPAVVVQLGTWLLSAAGMLSFSPLSQVPLPAAVWLLLSGIAGFGAVSRRRAVSGAAA